MEDNLSLSVDAVKLNKPKKHKIKMLITCILLVVIAIPIVLYAIVFPLQYNKAIKLIVEKEYYKAYSIFEKLGDYKDSKKELEKFFFQPGILIKTYNDGSEGKEEYLYDHKGNLIREINPAGTCSYSYDGENNLTKKVDTFYGNKVTTEYSYDKKGNLVLKVLDDDGLFTKKNSVTKYTYDLYNNPVMEYSETHGVFGDKEENSKEYEYTYDSKGDMKTKKVYNNKKLDITYTYNYEYDLDSGRLKSTEEVKSYPDGTKFSIKCVYNERGNIIKESNVLINGINKGGVFKSSGDKTMIEYYYDNYDNLIKEVHIGVDNEKDITEYEYDTKNNLVKKTYSRSNGYAEIEEYYDYKIFYKK